jgi:hypothetical protein
LKKCCFFRLPILMCCGFRYVRIHYLYFALLPTLCRVFNLEWNYYKRDFLQYNSLCWENFKVCAWSEFIYKNDRENFSKIVVRWSRYVESRLLGKFWFNCKDFLKGGYTHIWQRIFIMLTWLFNGYTCVIMDLTNYDFVYLNRYIQIHVITAFKSLHLILCEMKIEALNFIKNNWLLKKVETVNKT